MDLEKLRALAEAATQGRVHDRLDSCGGGLKYECFGDDGSLVLKVDHKNDEWGFVGERGEQDEAFFLACTPAAVLEMIAEIELDNKIIAERELLLSAIPECAAHGKCVPYAIQWVKDTQTQVAELLEERDQLKAENDRLREQLADNELQAKADAAFLEHCQEQGF